MRAVPPSLSAARQRARHHLVAMVLHVVRLEGDRIGDADRHVGERGDAAVHIHGLGREVVRDLVHGEEEGVVRRRADDVTAGAKGEDSGARASGE